MEIGYYLYEPDDLSELSLLEKLLPFVQAWTVAEYKILAMVPKGEQTMDQLIAEREQIEGEMRNIIGTLENIQLKLNRRLASHISFCKYTSPFFTQAAR